VAYDAAVAAILRAALADEPATERRMFGALAFMRRGNMLCGALAEGGFFRVGPEGMAAALAEDGAAPMTMRDRPMTGFAGVTDEGVDSDDALRGWIAYAEAHVRKMPPK
jgi:hypothetical protein